MDNNKSFAHFVGPSDCGWLGEKCEFASCAAPPKSRGGIRFGRFVHRLLPESASANALVALYEPDGTEVTVTAASVSRSNSVKITTALHDGLKDLDPKMTAASFAESLLSAPLIVADTAARDARTVLVVTGANDAGVSHFTSDNRSSTYGSAVPCGWKLLRAHIGGEAI
jgi:hypothetical protein